MSTTTNETATREKPVGIEEGGGQRWLIKGKANEAEGFVTIGYVMEIGSRRSANFLNLAAAIGYREFLIIDRKPPTTTNHRPTDATINGDAR